MGFYDLKKFEQLLIYMSNNETSTGYPFNFGEDADVILAEGISATKASLSNMLFNMKKNGFVENLSRGYWALTQEGRSKAAWLMKKCDELEAEEETEIDHNYLVFLREENAKLREENARLKEKLALVKKVIEFTN